jgi:hypothetical protein
MPINRRSLRADWRGKLTADSIASKHGISRQHVNRLWAAEQIAGRLPHGPRPHFQPTKPKPPAALPAIASPPLSENNGMRLRKDNLAAGVDTVMAAIAALPDDMRQDAAETALAATICSSFSGDRRHPFTVFDLANLHVSAMIRRHQSGERPLPVIPVIEGPGMSMTSAGSFAEECTVALSSGGRARRPS